MSNNELSGLLIGGGIVAGVLALLVGKRAQAANVTITHPEQDANQDQDMETNTKLPRGYRNNNPLNIRISSSDWEGKVPVAQNTDGVFEQFTEMAYGYRAAFVLLRNYINKYGCDTIAKIITRWAPEEDGNNTQRYIERVCKSMGLPADTYINPYSESLMSSLVYAMSLVENGTKIKPDEQAISQGWNYYI